MEADSRGSIQVEINMMDLVKSPEKRNAMDKDMPDVQRVIEYQHSERDFKPRRQTQRFQESPAPAVDDSCERANQRSFRPMDRGGAEPSHCEIPARAAQFVFGAFPQRVTALQPIQRCKRP